MIIAPFYPILDVALLRRLGLSPLLAAEALLEAGAGILQLREKGHFSRALFAEAERIGEMCRTAGALFVINDRADMAALLGAALHVGQEDLLPTEARRVLPAGSIVGFSTHNEAQLRAAVGEPVDYVALGPVFETGSKENPDPVVGIEEFRKLRSLAIRPLVAIGGITRANARSVLDAGADSVAVIGDVLPVDGSYRSLRERAAEWIACTAG